MAAISHARATKQATLHAESQTQQLRILQNCIYSFIRERALCANRALWTPLPTPLDMALKRRMTGEGCLVSNLSPVLLSTCKTPAASREEGEGVGFPEAAGLDGLCTQMCPGPYYLVVYLDVPQNTLLTSK